MRCPFCLHRLAAWRSLLVASRRGALRCPGCRARLRRAPYYRRGRADALLAFLALYAFALFGPWALWQISPMWVLWLVGYYGVHARYVELEPARDD